MFLHGNLESHSVWNENRSLWTPTFLTYVICVTWKQQVGASFVLSVVQTSYVFRVPMLYPEHKAYLASLVMVLFSLKAHGINWIECVDQFYAVFSNFFFGLHLCLSGIISLFLPFFLSYLKLSNLQIKFQIPVIICCKPRGVWQLRVSKNQIWSFNNH